ncbi:MAG: YihY/virulence factor BrkB family protein [Chloroflexota bacterium]
MSTGGVRSRVDGLVARGRKVADRVLEVPIVRTLVATLEVYDTAGGGLVANGLAYAALFAMVPGLLLVLSVVGLVVADPAAQKQIVEAIVNAFPPLQGFAQAAFAQVSAGAVPTGIVAIVGLLWGSSRFYAALDVALSRVFHKERRRNELERGVRGILVSIVFVALPLLVVILGSVISWLMDLAPRDTQVQGAIRTLLQLGSPVGSSILFIGGTVLVYRYVPPVRVPMRTLWVPSVAIGLIVGGFTQLFVFIAPRMLGWASLFGALVAVFAVLVWLSISLNVLLIGACWARVRLAAEAHRAALAVDREGKHPDE